MMKHRVRGAALVEYAFILVCVTGLAGGSMKLVHAKTAATANLASSGLTVAGSSGGGSSGGGSKGGSASGNKPGGGGSASKPKNPKKGPKEIGANDDQI